MKNSSHHHFSSMIHIDKWFLNSLAIWQLHFASKDVPKSHHKHLPSISMQLNCPIRALSSTSDTSRYRLSVSILVIRPHQVILVICRVKPRGSQQKTIERSPMYAASLTLGLFWLSRVPSSSQIFATTTRAPPAPRHKRMWRYWKVYRNIGQNILL